MELSVNVTADAGWGAWSIEVGWTQAWIPTVLAMRELNVDLWDLTRKSRIVRHWDQCRSLMLYGESLPIPEPVKPPRPKTKRQITGAKI